MANCRLDFALAADQPGSLSHADEAKARPGRRSSYVKAASIICYPKVSRVIVQVERSMDARRSPVADCVIQRFLQDAVQTKFNLAIQS